MGTITEEGLNKLQYIYKTNDKGQKFIPRNEKNDQQQKEKNG